MTVPGSANPLLLRSAAPTAYQVSRSLRFNGSVDNSYLSRTPGSAGNRKTWTFSCWVKRSSLGARQVIFGTGDASFNNANWIEFFNTDTLRIGDFATTTQYNVITTQVFRDVSAWGHLVVAVDTTQATASNRVRAYWNGSEITAFSTATYPTQNLDTQLNTTTAHGIGRGGTYNAQYFNGYLAECHFVNGLQLTPSSFGETDTNGEWQPKLYSGSYGSQGWKLTFADNSNNTASTLGADTSGNGNNWTPNNLSVTAGAGNDSLTDTPTSYGSGTSGGDVRGNFATLNPLSTSSGTYSQGNLRFEGANSWMNSNGTFAVSTGKWYYEVTVANAPFSPRSSTSEYNGFGWGLSNVQAATTTPRTQSDALMYGDNGYYKNFSGSNTDGGAVSAGDVLAVAVDLDANTFYLYKNNSQIATGTIGGTAGRELTPRISSYSGSYGALDVNFGQRAFAYTPPANFKPLVDTYLPTPTVAKPSEVMDVKLYTGNGSTQTVSGLGFNPDLVWIKGRSLAATHTLTDSVRGTNSQLFSNRTDAQETVSDALTAFNSDGFSLGANTSGVYPHVNVSGYTYVGWCWDAGTSTVTLNPGDPGAGSISSQVRANATSGFSVATFSASADGDVGHGLGVKPGLIILKNRDQALSWAVWHQSFTSPQRNYLYLNTTDAVGDAGVDIWGTSSYPNSNTFWFRYGSWASGGSRNLVAYCFAPVAGYSSFGSYTGNGSTDGPFVYTGFRPRWVMIKATGGSTGNENWMIKDALRPAYNPTDGNLYANQSFAEDSASTVITDLVSNGFKIRGTYAGVNTSAVTYIYCAFAESPLQYARAR